MSFRRGHRSEPFHEVLEPHAQAFRRSFTDEVAIDFPSSRAAIEFFRRDTAYGTDPAPSTHAEVTISMRQAGTGARVPLEVPVHRTCGCCGGRGEVWSDPCQVCAGQGHKLHRQSLTVSVPRGVIDGDRFSFNICPPCGPRTRVDVRVAVTA